MKRPRLHLADLDHDSRVLGAVDELLIGNDNYREHTRKILAAQDRLQALCESDAWIAFLDVEQLVNARVNFMLSITARWAFHEGRRSGRRS